MYRYETHLHTSPVSSCAKASVRENLEFYKSLGFASFMVSYHSAGRCLHGQVIMRFNLPQNASSLCFPSNWKGKGTGIYPPVSLPFL